MAFGKTTIENGFNAIEEKFKTYSGKFCIGDDISIADLCLVPQIYNANRFNVDMEKYPTIKKIGENLNRLAAFQKAHPSNQPDAM